MFKKKKKATKKPYISFQQLSRK